MIVQVPFNSIHVKWAVVCYNCSVKYEKAEDPLRIVRLFACRINLFALIPITQKPTQNHSYGGKSNGKHHCCQF